MKTAARNGKHGYSFGKIYFWGLSYENPHYQCQWNVQHHVPVLTPGRALTHCLRIGHKSNTKHAQLVLRSRAIGLPHIKLTRTGSFACLAPRRLNKAGPAKWPDCYWAVCGRVNIEKGNEPWDRRILRTLSQRSTFADPCHLLRVWGRQHVHTVHS